MPRSAALPFTLRKSSDVIERGRITTTTETIHGLLRLNGDALSVQWRLVRRTDLVGPEIRSDEELEDVREVSVPLVAVAGAVVRRPWWNPWRGLRIVVTAADLRGFEGITGEDGLRSAHPAELTLRLRRGDRLAAEEFAAELSLALAERQLEERMPDQLRAGERFPDEP